MSLGFRNRAIGVGAVKTSIPFICTFIPFVCRSRPFVNTFVGINLPFVGKSTFQFGFTIIELLITLSILAILSTLAGPSLINFVKNNRLTAAVNDLVTDLNYSRAEAIKRGVAVTICASTNAESSTPSCSGASDWARGRLIFVDPNGNGSLEGDETVLRRHNALSGTSTLHTLDSTAGIYDYDPSNRITFDARGNARSVSGNPVLFAVCDDRNAASNPPWKQVEVLPSGLIRSGSLSTSTCS